VLCSCAHIVDRALALQAYLNQETLTVLWSERAVPGPLGQTGFVLVTQRLGLCTVGRCLQPVYALLDYCNALLSLSVTRDSEVVGITHITRN
jgi:hypothetical protein